MDLIHNDVTNCEARGEFWSQQSRRENSKQPNSHTVECACAAVLCRLLKANEYRSSFARVFRGLIILKLTATVRFHRPVRPKKVTVLRVVFLVVLPTIQEISSFPFFNFQNVKIVESKELCKKCVISSEMHCYTTRTQPLMSLEY